MINILLSIKLILCKISSNSLFILEIRNSQIRHVSGVKNTKFLNDCEDIVKENNLTFGLIYAVKDTNGKTRIKTSSEISKASAQRIRNLWSFYS